MAIPPGTYKDCLFISDGHSPGTYKDCLFIYQMDIPHGVPYKICY